MAILFCNNLVSPTGKELDRALCPPLPELPGVGPAADDAHSPSSDGRVANRARRQQARAAHTVQSARAATESAPPALPRAPNTARALRSSVGEELPRLGRTSQAQSFAVVEPGGDGDLGGSLWDEWKHLLQPGCSAATSSTAAPNTRGWASASKGFAATCGGTPWSPGATTSGGFSAATRTTGAFAPKVDKRPRDGAKGVALPSLSAHQWHPPASGRHSGRAAQDGRPGSQLTGRMALADSSSLASDYSLICKDDVTQACSRHEDAARNAAARRRDSAAKQGRLERQRAARWRGKTSATVSVDILRRATSGASTKGSNLGSIMSSRQVSGHDDLDLLDGTADKSQDDGYPRWKRAWDRIAQRDVEAESRRISNDPAASSRTSRRPSAASAASAASSLQRAEVEEQEGGEELKELSEDELADQSKHASTEDVARDFLSQLKSKANKSLNWRKNQTSLDAHFQSLSRLKKVEERIQKLQRTQDARKRRFYTLPSEEMDMYTSIFQYLTNFDGPPSHEIVLDAASVRLCAVEAGLGGIGCEEQVAVLNLCSEVARAPHSITLNANYQQAAESEGPLYQVRTGVNLYTFACSVVPNIRNLLTSLRSDRLEDLVDERDDEQTGMMGLQDCRDIAAAMAGVDKALSTIRVRAAEIFDEQTRERQLTDELRPKATIEDLTAPRSVRKTQIPESDVGSTNKVANRYRSNPPGASPKKDAGKKEERQSIGTDMLARLVDNVCQDACRAAHVRERELQRLAKMSNDTFSVIRPDLQMLKDLFERLRLGRRISNPEPDHSPKPFPAFSGSITTPGCQQLLLEFGLRDCSRVSQDLAIVEEAAEESDGTLNFSGVMDVVQKVRGSHASMSFQPLKDKFIRFAAFECRLAAESVADKKGELPPPRGKLPNYIPLLSVANFVEQFRCLPRRRELQEVLNKVLDEHLTYSTECLSDGQIPPGTIGFAAMVRVLQRCSECLARLDFKKEEEVAEEHGFQTADLVELHSVFDALDDDCSLTLDKMEVWEAVRSLGFKLSASQYDSVFRQCDLDNSGQIDFEEFLGLLALARDGVGAFATNERQIVHLSDLFQMEVERILGFFGRNARVSVSRQRARRSGVMEAGADASAKQPNEADLAELCDCLDLKLTTSLPEVLNVRTVQDLFSFALGYCGIQSAYKQA